MAEVDTLMLSQEHSDIRREAAEHTNEIVKEGIKGDYATQTAIKDAQFSLDGRLVGLGDNVDNRFFHVGRDTSDLRAQVVSLAAQTAAGFSNVAKDTEIATLKTQVEMGKQTTYLSDKIGDDGEKTRALIASLRDAELNRLLVERNAELVASLDNGRYWRGRWDDGQYQAIASQLQAFQSQLQETRQGMVNFGTMAGVGQTSTSNNVR